MMRQVQELSGRSAATIGIFRFIPFEYAEIHCSAASCIDAEKV
jgi:hypothetical protein